MREYPARLIEALEERGFNREAMDTLSPKELIKEYAGWHMGYREWGSDFFELCEAVSPLRAKLALAEKALAPFAQAADQCERDKDGTSVFINVSRLREARAALTAIREGRE